MNWIPMTGSGIDDESEDETDDEESVDDESEDETDDEESVDDESEDESDVDSCDIVDDEGDD